MTSDERAYLYQEIDKFNLSLPLIINFYYNDLTGRLSLINILYDKMLSRKILIRNEYGVLGNLLYKYRSILDSDILLYLLDRDIKTFKIEKLIKPKLEEIKLNLKFTDVPFICLNANSVKVKDKVFYNFLDNLKDNKNIVMEVIREDCYALEYAGDTAKLDRNIILEAITKDGFVLQYADKKFLKDKEIVIKAILSNGYAIKYVFYDFIDDIDFLWNLLLSNPRNTFSNLNSEEYYILKDRIKKIYGIEDDKYRILEEKQYLFSGGSTYSDSFDRNSFPFKI